MIHFLKKKLFSSKKSDFDDFQHKYVHLFVLWKMMYQKKERNTNNTYIHCHLQKYTKQTCFVAYLVYWREFFKKALRLECPYITCSAHAWWMVLLCPILFCYVKAVTCNFIKIYLKQIMIDIIMVSVLWSMYVNNKTENEIWHGSICRLILFVLRNL